MCIWPMARGLASYGLIRYHLHFIVDDWKAWPLALTPARLSPAVRLGHAVGWLTVYQYWTCGSRIDHHKLQHEANRFID